MIEVTEMREFFEKVIGDFTGLTEKARQVEELSSQMISLTERVNHLETERDNLRHELDEAWTYARKVEDDANHYRQELQTEKDRSQAFQDTIVAADSRVKDLTQQAVDANNTVASITNELNIANNKASDLDFLVSNLRQELAETQKERDNWKEDAQNAGNQVVELKATLARVQSILQPAPTNVEHFPVFNVG